MVTSDCVELDDLPPTVRGDYGAALAPSLRRNDSLRAWASRYARLVLERCDGNKREACRVLDISYHTLQSYLRFPVHAPCGSGVEAGPNRTSDPEDDADLAGEVEVGSMV
jgi:hypothetical protein